MANKRFSYELERDYYRQSWPQEVLPYLHLEPYLRCWLNPEEMFGDKRVLDIGAGECVYSRLIADRFESKSIVACDLFRERLRPSARANQNGKLRFVVADCFGLPFTAASFDVVFGSFILHQLPNLSDAADEIRRVLSAKGRYIGIEPNPFWALHLLRYLGNGHSPNQYLLRPKDLAVFQDFGFQVTVRYFNARLPRARSPWLTTCLGIIAERRPTDDLVV